MAILKKILSHPLVKMFLGNSILRTIFFILICAAPLFLLYRWWKKKKKKGGAKEEEEKKLAPSDLLRIWKNFKKQIPREFRRTISYYQHFVVMGEAGSGKTQLIDNYTDWQGQSYQFYPSYTTDPRLQLYLGTQELVQEIPSALLRDSSPEARKAFINFWQKLFKKTEPVVISTLKAKVLTASTPDALRRQAQMMRGKINIISRVRNEPVKVKIVLTHVDEMEGFLEFSTFLQKHNIPLKIDLEGQFTKEELQNCLASYEKYLPLALTTCNSGDYNKIMTFLNDVPDTFSALYLFLQTLQEDDPLSYSPEVKEIYLSSNIIGAQVSNPFSSSLPEEALPHDQNVIKKHRTIALTLLTLGVLYLFFSYFYEYRKIQQHQKAAQEMINLYRESPTPANRSAVEKELEKFQNIEEYHSLLRITPSFVADWDTVRSKVENQLEKVEKTFVQNIRQNKLLPLLKEFEGAKEQPYEKTLYVLAMIYATNQNAFGKIIRDNVTEWSKVLDLSEDNILKYIKNSDVIWNGQLQIDIEDTRRRNESFSVTDLQTWLVYFLKIEQAYTKPLLTKNTLRELQEKADRFREAIDRVRRFHRAKMLFERLVKLEESKLDIKRIYQPHFTRLQGTDWIYENYDNLNNFLLFISDSQLKIPQISKKNLHELVTDLNAIALNSKELIEKNIGKSKVKDTRFEFAVAKRSFVFPASQWVQLLERSKIRLLIQKFFVVISLDPRLHVNIFFTDANSFPDLEMNPDKYGTSFFSGKAKIPGKFTYLAYRKEVRPVLEKIEDLIENLPMTVEDKRVLENFVSQQAEQYARYYRERTENYFMSFKVNAPSTATLRLILSNMQLPSSPFYDFLTTIKKNTVLEKSKCRFLKPLYEKLEPFKKVNQLLAENNNKLKEYQKILIDIKSELEGLAEKKGGAKKKGEKGGDSPNVAPFQNILSPVGQMAYQIYKGSDNSYLELTKNWLKGVEIEDKWQKPFLSPIYQLYDLGLKDMEQNVNQSWQNLLLPKILPLLSKFPFNSKAEQNVTPAELEQVLHPLSDFWLNYKQLVAPVCEKKGNTWKRKIPFRGKIDLPKNLLKIINHLSYISRVLWDKKGKPLPIVLEIKPHPLPTVKLRGKMVILAYISSGDSELFSFNQKPQWQKFELKWWKEETSKIGIQLGDVYYGEKFYQDVVVSDKLWSFYRLLQIAKVVKKNEWTWYFPKESTAGELKIRFTLKSDPWKLFEIKGLE